MAGVMGFLAWLIVAAPLTVGGWLSVRQALIKHGKTKDHVAEERATRLETVQSLYQEGLLEAVAPGDYAQLERAERKRIVGGTEKHARHLQVIQETRREIRGDVEALREHGVLTQSYEEIMTPGTEIGFRLQPGFTADDAERFRQGIEMVRGMDERERIEPLEVPPEVPLERVMRNLDSLPRTLEEMIEFMEKTTGERDVVRRFTEIADHPHRLHPLKARGSGWSRRHGASGTRSGAETTTAARSKSRSGGRGRR
ncbi:hypothetical protein [Marinitenerispora sediminis]|uniref:Uncharacterized protein n=1 Tax=Marinitenerispora sediminis TaxID=1931232 RepID=A0A368T8D2_9ACTN|nr:hypothetical protein [Marinitenerispora sediminis]RCV51361.1 hypothetical protein DEF28_15670 [Marinitenerispora sediminis]RCV57189.1 hypothetical protein DEF23_11245 [Marinitenerispora sediminis]RCV60304.1 hypothetical protein DEF24_07455 [Marinitenerispora sediminis]